MKKLFLSLVALTVIVAMGYAGIKTLPLNRGVATTVVTNTVAASQVDTVKFSNEGNLDKLSFNAYFSDSVSITRCIVLRVQNGVPMTLFAGDTLTSFTSFAKNGSGNPTSAVGSAVAVQDQSLTTGATLLRPATEEFWFVVTYAGSAIGTSTSVTYKAHKVLTK